MKWALSVWMWHLTALAGLSRGSSCGASRAGCPASNAAEVATRISLPMGWPAVSNSLQPWPTSLNFHNSLRGQRRQHEVAIFSISHKALAGKPLGAVSFRWQASIGQPCAISLKAWALQAPGPWRH